MSSSSSSGSELKRWNFSAGSGEKETYFPDNYMSYKRLLAGEENSDVNKCYFQDVNKNLINLWCAFITAMKVKGFGDTIIDVNASIREHKIVKSKNTGIVSEVILRKILDNGEKLLVGLFRGSCSSTDKKGLLNFSLFGSSQTCNPSPGSEQDPQQVAYFPSEYFDRLSSSKGFGDSVSSAVKSKLHYEYISRNPLNYVFFSGTFKSDNNIIRRSGPGRMLRKTEFYDSEIIIGVWGRDIVDSSGKNVYDDNYVQDAKAFRKTDNEKGTCEGIAIGGVWSSGTYYGGKCLSWRLNYGSTVVFNYTGNLNPESTQPVGGFITFEEICYF